MDVFLERLFFMLIPPSYLRAVDASRHGAKILPKCLSETRLAFGMDGSG